MAEAVKARLNEVEIERYRADGLVVPQWRLPQRTLGRMREALDRLIRDNPAVSPDAMYCPHIVEGGCQGLRGHEEWLEFAHTPEILDMVEQVIGPDFLLWGTTVFGKPANSGKETPWHQDGEYWPIKPLATCSVWIALDESSPENGCLRIIPGSHLTQRVRHHNLASTDTYTLNQKLEDGEFDETEARDVILEPGQISLHDVYLIHGSMPNRSPRRRAGYVLRFMPTTSHFDRAFGAELTRRSGAVDFVNRPLWLMRGVDRCGFNDFSVGHSPALAPA